MNDEMIAIIMLVILLGIFIAHTVLSIIEKRQFEEKMKVIEHIQKQREHLYEIQLANLEKEKHFFLQLLEENPKQNKDL